MDAQISVSHTLLTEKCGTQFQEQAAHHLPGSTRMAAFSSSTVVSALILTHLNLDVVWPDKPLFIEMPFALRILELNLQIQN
jgi:hypothetical protein